MPTIIFTAGAKGGTGKSTAIRFLITYLREYGLDPLLLDMDDENHTLTRFFPEARLVETKKSSSYDILVEETFSGHDLIVADMKAGTGRNVLDWWLGVPFHRLPDVRFICLATITSSPDSVQSLMNWVSALKNRVTYIICKNQKDGEIFPDYETSVESLKFQKTIKPYHVVIPRIDEEYMTELERLDLTVAEVIEPVNGLSTRGKEIGSTLCRFMVRARLEQLQLSINDQFDVIPELVNHVKEIV